VINLSEESEPDIFRAIKKENHLENVVLKKRQMKLTLNVSITPNTELVTQYTILTTFNQVLLEKSQKHIFPYCGFIWS
jgi:ATP-dependent phosphoenolpyruvate carboxykinase